jgi:hypothetical protein
LEGEEAMPKFNVGDRVEIVRVDYSDTAKGIEVGMRGTVLEHDDVPYVSIDELHIITPALTQDQLELIEGKERTFIIGSVNNHQPGFSVSKNPVKHSDLIKAKQEAERLATTSNKEGVEFIVLEVIGSVKKVSSPLVWK